MKKLFQSHTVMLLSSLALSFAVVGCVQSGPDSAENSANEKNTKVAESDHDDHDHSGWWCGEHGVPEDVCTRCDSSLIADFKSKKDWCEEHDRPDSQCFLCHPDLEAKFAARYEAKFGEKPPKITDP